MNESSHMGNFSSRNSMASGTFSSPPFSRLWEGKCVTWTSAALAYYPLSFAAYDIQSRVRLLVPGLAEPPWTQHGFSACAARSCDATVVQPPGVSHVTVPFPSSALGSSCDPFQKQNQDPFSQMHSLIYHCPGQLRLL